MDLLSLVARDTRLRKAASTAGGEWCGPCPFCGGRDRFRVQPERGRWWCRQCSADGRWEDAIAYLRRRDGLTFGEACAALGRFEPGPAPPPPRPARRPNRDAGWEQAAARAALACERQLWTPNGERARQWLARRGLRAETVRAWRVGYSPGERVGPLWIPRGIVLPWRADGRVHQLKIRRPAVAPGEPRYASVRGGHPHLFGAELLRGREALALAEGELDAMLLWQEAGDLIDVATLGSCSALPDEDVMWRLLPYRRVLVAYDADPRGEEGAEHMLDLSARMLRTRPGGAGDLTDFFLAGGSLRDWIRFHVARCSMAATPSG